MKAIVHREEDRAKAMLTSLMLHLGLLALFMFYKFAAPEKVLEPPPILIEMSSLGGGGTDVAEGEPDRGMNSTSAPDAPVPDEAALTPPKPTPAPPVVSEAPAKPTPTTEDPEVAALRRQQEEEKRKQQEEQQKIAEQKRKEQEAAAAKAKQEADRKKKIEGAFGGGTGSGSGTGGKPGNQGAQGGTGSNPFGGTGTGGGSGGGSGTGTGTSVGGGIGNRKRLKEVPPAYNSQEKGTVRVKICVDSEGNVIEATPTTTGSTTSSGTLRSAAEKAAWQWKFVAAPGADKQCGWIDFNFILK